MALSSTNLFHFTKSYELLVTILKEGMWPRYCMEREWGEKDLFIPMVCTCDIPLSEIKTHMKKYGDYGIGLDKPWAKRQGFTPVLYLSDRSSIYKILQNYAKDKLVEADKTKWNSINEEVMLYYAKRSVGTDADRESLRMKLHPRFSNEKEWRFVPELSESVYLRWETQGKGQDYPKEKLHSTTANQKIRLKPDNIVYIIVKEERERQMLINDLKKIFAQDDKLCNGENKLEVLCSRIISKEQITVDF